MKKIFTFLAIALMAIAWTDADARWVIGERKNASQIKAGDTVVIQFAGKERYSDCYLQLADDDHKDLNIQVTQGTGLGASAIITFEEGPQDIRTEAPTLYMKFVGNGTYIANTYYNWYETGMVTTTAVDKAAPFQVLDMGQNVPWYDEANDRTQWHNDNDAICDANSVAFSVSPSETTFAYLSFWFNSSRSMPRAITWSYCACNQWNVYTATYVEDLREDLEKLINTYTDDAEYIGGTDPGFYEQDKVDAYEEMLASALNTCYDASSTDEQLRAAYDDLMAARAAMTASLIPMSEGYYYILSDFEDIVNNGVAEKAVYVNEDAGQIWYGRFDADDIKFVFKVKAREDGTWNIQSLKSDQYFGSVPQDGFTKPHASALDDTYYEALTCWPGTGSWYIQSHNTFRYWAMTAHGDPSTSDDAADYLYAYNGAEVNNAPHLKWGWRFQRLTDEQLDKFKDEKEQVDRTADLKKLVEEGSELYANLFIYKVDDEGLIKVVNGGAYEEPTDESQIRFGTARGDGASYLYMAGKYEYLIDDYDSTYIKCGDYIDIDISKTPLQTITFMWGTRCASMTAGTANQHKWGVEERPNKIEIYASNDTIGGNWTKVGGNSFGNVTDEERANPFPPVYYTLDMGETYKYVRYVVLSNANGGTGCTLASFQVYGSTVDKETSQYYTTEGMSDKAEAMNERLKAAAAIVAANTATQEDIQALRAAIDAVKELYADTVDLANLIAESEILLDGVQIGDGMGQLSDESLATALQEAIADARKNAFVVPVSVAAVQEATAAVKAAKDAFLAGLKSFEVGKWYFITNLDTERNGEVAAEDAYCYGNAIYLNAKRAGSSVTKWGLYDRTAQTLNADGNPKAMWQFVPVEGTEYYAIQNLYTGYYLGDFAGNNINLPVSETPVPYDVAYIGNAKFTLTPKTRTNVNNYALWPEGFENDVVCHVVNEASAWTFVEIDPEEQEGISISDFSMNYTDIMALPYDIKDIAEYNDDVHTYAVRRITQEMDGDETVTTIEFYEKSEFRAGEPCLIVLGDTATETAIEEYDLVIPFPTEIVDHNYEFVSNGILGGLHDTKCDAGTAICSDGKHFHAVTADGSGFGAQTGVFDLSTYTGEVAGVATDYTLVIRGMAKMATEGDVNGDGEVNTADVVAVYNWIIDGDASGVSKEAADVDGDGEISTADVVAIYNIIVGAETAASPVFKAQMQSLLAK